jgi:hypothetical protein
MLGLRQHRVTPRLIELPSALQHRRCTRIAAFNIDANWNSIIPGLHFWKEKLLS